MTARWLGEPRYKTKNKIEILFCIKYVWSNPLTTVEPKTGIVDTGAIINYIKPSDPHK